MARLEWLLVAALPATVIVAGSCGEAFVAGGGSGGSGAGIGGSADGGTGGVAGGGGVAGSGAGQSGGQGGAHGGMGGSGPECGSGGATACLCCAEAFEIGPPPPPTQVCEGAERVAYTGLRECICNVLYINGLCLDCSDYCANTSAPSSSCVSCADAEGDCDSVGEDCGVSPF